MTKNKIQILRFIFAFFAIFAMLNCSKDDSNNNETPDNKSVETNRYESILIKVPNMELTQNQYEATFGSLNIQVLKIDSNTLTFMIPADAPLGNIELNIPDLNNTKLTYTVLQPTLVKTPQETVAPLFSEFETFFTDSSTPTLEGAIAKNNYLQFKNYWNSTATNLEKEQIALWYQTNKTLIDEIFHLENINGSTTRNTNSRMMKTSGFSLNSIFGSYTHVVGRVVAIAGVGLTGAAIATAGIVSAPVLAGIAVIGVGIKICNAGNDQILEDIRIRLNIATDGLSGNVNKSRMVDNSIKLISDKLQPIPFHIQSGTISREDENSSNDLLKEYFSTTSILNNTIDNVDNTIDWVNSKKATSYQPFDEVDIPANSTDEMLDITPEIMQGIKFSISHPNLQLINATLATDGQLNLKVKIVGNPAKRPVISTLNYSYSDEISKFAGHFDISVGEVPDKIIRYNIIVDGVSYSGEKHLYTSSNGYYDESGSYFYYNDNQSMYNLTISYDEGKQIIMQEVNLLPNGNFNLSSMIHRDVDEGYTYYSINSGTVLKTGNTSFTFNGIYKQYSLQMSASGSITVE